MIGLILKSLPWKNIILGLLIGGVALSIVLYIKNAENNRARVHKLESVKEELLQTNAENIKFFEKNIQVLQAELVKERERETDYAENIKIIQAGEDGTCVRSSPAIIESLRMRLERRASD